MTRRLAGFVAWASLVVTGCYYSVPLGDGSARGPGGTAGGGAGGQGAGGGGGGQGGGAGAGGGGGKAGSGGDAGTAEAPPSCGEGMRWCECTRMCYSQACLACCMFCNPDAAPVEDASGMVCGGFSNQQCSPGSFCEYPPGNCYQGNRDNGMCVEKPMNCPESYIPVCGCDGVTYPNDCQRQAAGVNLDHDGPC
jgi:hypothetical protein